MAEKAGRENRSHVRVKLDRPLKVVMGSIGADIRYELVTRNVSLTGFFLDFDKPGRFPFTPASIMEVWLELEPGVTIFFNGKMARVVLPSEASGEDTGPGIAIKIVQIDHKNDQVLKDFITSKSPKAQRNSGAVA